MAIERFANAAQTTLAAAITGVGDTTCTVASAALFPATGNFRLLIDSEILLCTGVAGAVFTVSRGQEGTVAAVHALNATVTLIVTAQSAAFGGISTLTGAECRTVPVSSDYTWINQETATVTDGPQGFSLYAPAGAGNDVRLLKKALPSAPYTLTALVRFGLFAVSTPAAGLCLRESGTGELLTFGIRGTGSFMAQKYNSPTSYNSGYSLTLSSSPLYLDPVCLLRIVDDATTRYYQYSPDGLTFLTLYSVGRTDFATPDEAGVFAEAGNATYPAVVTLYAWQET